MKQLRGYIFSRSFMGERVPQHVQNIVLRDYCQKTSNEYLLSAVEYAMNNSFLVLNQTLNELKEIDGIVAYSLFQLPEKKNNRMNVYSKIIATSSELHFAVEGLKVSSQKDIGRVE